jgi:hypothetical protein
MAARFALLLLLVVSAGADAASPQESLDTAIPDAIKLLEGKQYIEFVKRYGPPREAKFVSSLNLDGQAEFIAQFGKGKGPKLLTALRDIKGTKPTLSDDGKKATFKLKTKVGDKESMTWNKDGKNWRIAN